MSEPATAAPVEPVRYSIVIPFRNEAGNVTQLITEIAHAMHGAGRYEIIAVDDASHDGTASELHAALRATTQPGRVLIHARNRGQSAALCTGFDAARGEWIITLDGDGQNDPADIPALLRGIDCDNPPALICGHRGRRQDDWLRRLSSRIANRVRGALLGDDTPDTGCGLKIMDRRIAQRLPRFDHMHRFFPALFRRHGSEIISVPVNHRPRAHGISNYGVWNRLWVGIIDLGGVLWLQRRAFPPAAIEELRHDD